MHPIESKSCIPDVAFFTDVAGLQASVPGHHVGRRLDLGALTLESRKKYSPDYSSVFPRYSSV